MTPPDGSATSVRPRLATKPPFSYRQDPSVPDFPDDKPLIVFDGICVLCTGFARFVVRHDRAQQFRFASTQSNLGQALFRHYNLDPINYETNLLIAEGLGFGKMDAMIWIMRRLGWPWRFAGALACLPHPLANWLYDRIARNRYRLFGRSDVCVRPDASWQDRLLD